MQEKVMLTTLDAARVLGVGPDSVRHYERIGKLRAMRTGSGIRLFTSGEVERLRKEREAKSHRMAK